MLDTIRERVKEILDSKVPLELKSIKLDNYFTAEGEPSLEEVSYMKNFIQEEALQSIVDNGGSGLIAMATGTGKSKVAIDYIVREGHNIRVKELREPSVLLAVPTETLRDVSWKEEFGKWGQSYLYNNISRECYASLNKLSGNHYDIVILDEGHNITENNSEFFSQNIVKNVVILTATKPDKQEKRDILAKLAKVTYEVPLDLAVRMRLVAPYKITVIETRLDSVDKYIKAGSKAKPFMQTEKQAYDYMDSKVKKMMFVKTAQGQKAFQFMLLKRMRFIYDLASKTKAARKILELIPREKRVVTFCGSIAQAEKLADKDTESESLITFHSKSRDDWFNSFKDETVARLTCVNSLNEGHNIPNVDIGFIVQANSNEKDLVQRIGRTIRFRPGHVGNIIILCSTETQDLKWVQNAIRNLDATNVTWVRLENILSKNFELDF